MGSICKIRRLTPTTTIIIIKLIIIKIISNWIIQLRKSDRNHPRTKTISPQKPLRTIRHRKRRVHNHRRKRAPKQRQNRSTPTPTPRATPRGLCSQGQGLQKLYLWKKRQTRTNPRRKGQIT